MRRVFIGGLTGRQHWATSRRPAWPQRRRASLHSRRADAGRARLATIRFPARASRPSSVVGVARTARRARQQGHGKADLMRWTDQCRPAAGPARYMGRIGAAGDRAPRPNQPQAAPLAHNGPPRRVYAVGRGNFSCARAAAPQTPPKDSRQFHTPQTFPKVAAGPKLPQRIYWP